MHQRQHNHQPARGGNVMTAQTAAKAARLKHTACGFGLNMPDSGGVAAAYALADTMLWRKLPACAFACLLALLRKLSCCVL